jgi:hypothetical protein
MRIRSLLAALIVTTTLVLAAGASARPGPPSDVRGAFFANWDRYARGYLVKQIPADKLSSASSTHSRSPSASRSCGRSGSGAHGPGRSAATTTRTISSTR